MSSSRLAGEEGRAASPSNGAWWQSLPYNFTHLRQATHFSGFEALGVKASAASDIVLRTIGATLIRSTALRSTLSEQSLRDERSEFVFYQRAASGADPDVLFRTPPSSVESGPTTGQDATCAARAFRSHSGQEKIPLRSSFGQAYLTTKKPRTSRIHEKIRGFTWSTRPDSNWHSLRGLRPLILAAR